MKAILTKYVGPTNTRGSRIVVTDGDTRMLVNYDDACTTDEAHAKAAVAFCERLGWTGDMIQGGLKVGCVHVFNGLRHGKAPRVLSAFTSKPLACGRLTISGRKGA